MQTLGEYTLLYAGREPRFPDGLDYYNLWELMYAGEGGILTVYTDVRRADIEAGQYGEYELKAVKGYHVEGLSLRDFSPTKLKEYTEWCIRIEEREGE
jgi:hypothetical protein